MAADCSAVSLEPQGLATPAMGLPQRSGCLNCCCRLLPTLSTSDRLPTHLARPLTLCGDRSAIHPAHELHFDIRKQHQDSDTQR